MLGIIRDRDAERFMVKAKISAAESVTFMPTRQLLKPTTARTEDWLFVVDGELRPRTAARFSHRKAGVVTLAELRPVVGLDAEKSPIPSRSTPAGLPTRSF